jgi:hypothetical protein
MHILHNAVKAFNQMVNSYHYIHVCDQGCGFKIRNKLIAYDKIHAVNINAVFRGSIRWFDKSIQFSAFCNGKVGTNVEHASVDATVSRCVTSNCVCLTLSLA